MELERELSKILKENQILTQEPMSKHTTFRIGGPADYYVKAEVGQVKSLIELCKHNDLPYMIMGNGSNMLVGDLGIRGLVIALEQGADLIEGPSEDGLIKCQAGALLSRVAARALEHSLTGFEFAAGIPGSVGGGLYMNAGAYGGELKDILVEVEALTQDGELVYINKEDYQGGYRCSRVSRDNLIVLSGSFGLEAGDKTEIKARMDELRDKRVSKQPLEFPSAGSTFKRPEGYFAGKLIQDSGLAGYTVGGAQVSEKHCGFVINRGGATAADVRQLMEDVISRVRDNYGVTLEPEVRLIGEF